MKQIIVMRTDLNMRKGKMIAQGAHASLGVTLKNLDDPRVREWLSGAFAKICVRADSAEEIWLIIEAAHKAGLLYTTILDSGRTEFHGVSTLTCAAVGPDRDEALDPITGGLKLL